MPPKRPRRTAAQRDPVEQVFDINSISDSPTPDNRSSNSSVVVTRSQLSPSRQRLPSQRTRGSGSTRRSTRKKAQESDVAVPAVFREMVAEDLRRERRDSDSEDRATKRRKEKGKKAVTVSDSEEDIILENQNPVAVANDDEEDTDEESDVDWEDVDLSAKPIGVQDLMRAHQNAPPPPLPKPVNLELVLNDPAARKAAEPRRKITAVERRIRLETHKMHTTCLIFHAYLRNSWCNNAEVKEHLLPLLPEKAYDKLHHDPTDQQFRRSKFFLDGLKEAADAFHKKFKISRRGLTAPQWQDLEVLKKWSVPYGTELITKEDFIRASATLSGSRDLGAQLFCAFLRAAGITTRLVVSLQVLPFTFASKQKPAAPIPILIQSDPDSSPSPAPSPAPRRVSGLRRPPLRTPAIAAQRAKLPKPTKQEIVESAHPVYWVEAWSTPSQKWITIDPLVTTSVAKPELIEPPLSDPLNTLTYVVAFEDTGHAVDVTRRYAKFLSAKTRRSRVTSTKGGERWYFRLLRWNFNRGFDMDRDQLENAEFARLHLSEPLPNSVADLKDHPLFALKRHLKQGQVINPERKVGTVSAGKGCTEAIFRRQDVKEVKTSEQWYKLGRVVKENEIPLKFTAARKMVRKHRLEEEEDEEKPHQPMFAEHQTDVFKSHPVVNGLIPKNRFGNLDVFVPTMVPDGGVHIPHPLARNAARLIGVDYADAVTGFEFRNRLASPVIRGVVVAREYRDAILVGVRAFEYEKEKEESRKREAVALALWRRWILRLGIRERLGVGRDEVPALRIEEALRGRVGNPGRGKKQKRKSRVVEEGEEEEEGEEGEGEEGEEGEEEKEIGGGFFPESDEEEQGGGFGRGSEPEPDNAGGFLPEGEGFIPGDGYGGGFMPEDGGSSDGSDGGFLPDAASVGEGGFFPEAGATGGFWPEMGGGGGGLVAEHDGTGGFLHGTASKEEGGFFPEPAPGPVEDGRRSHEFLGENEAGHSVIVGDKIASISDIPDIPAPLASTDEESGARVGEKYQQPQPTTPAEKPAARADKHLPPESAAPAEKPEAQADGKRQHTSSEEEEEEEDDDPDWELFGL